MRQCCYSYNVYIIMDRRGWCLFAKCGLAYSKDFWVALHQCISSFAVVVGTEVVLLCATYNNGMLVI